MRVPLWRHPRSSRRLLPGGTATSSAHVCRHVVCEEPIRVPHRPGIAARRATCTRPSHKLASCRSPSSSRSRPAAVVDPRERALAQQDDQIERRQQPHPCHHDRASRSRRTDRRLPRRCGDRIEHMCQAHRRIQRRTLGAHCRLDRPDRATSDVPGRAFTVRVPNDLTRPRACVGVITSCDEEDQAERQEEAGPPGRDDSRAAWRRARAGGRGSVALGELQNRALYDLISQCLAALTCRRRSHGRLGG